ncbi:PilC/PilY family type IV pilus protein [Candidatus Marimicrobium litorale]|nr:PilC/PilY family type IV pilus protein [Candidatus Marimicrobium litorale]
MAPLAAAILVATPLWADDTEIFFGDLNGGGAATNVLFIIDTSGSMDNKDGTGQTRLSRVKDAMFEILGSLNNVNVGLMRFSNPGGPVIYPVTYIDKATDQGSGIVSTTSDVDAGDSDAVEDAATGVVLVDGNELLMGGVAGGGAGSDEFTITSTVDEPYEDAIEYNDGEVEFSAERNNGNWRPLELRGSNYKNFGLRFNGLDIPPGATILSAYLEMSNFKGAKNDQLIARIRGDFPPAWDFEEEDEDISGRVGAGSPTAFWTMESAGGGLPANGERLTSPDLKDLVQSLIDDNDWEGDEGYIDDIVLVIDCPDCAGSDKRRLYSVEGDASKSAKLTIRYTTGEEEIEPHVSGMRFGSVDIPLNVTVTSAKLVFEPLVANLSPAELTVSIEDNDSPALYEATSANVSGRSYSAGIDWDEDDDWTPGDTVQVDVTSIVNSHVKRSNWCGGDPMAFMVSGDGESRIAHSFDSATGSAPKLLVSYDRATLVPGGSCRAITFRKRVVADQDDGQTSGAGTAVATGGNTIQINATKYGLFRFTDLDIPVNAQVKSAYLRVYSAADTSSAANLSISIEEAGNSSTLTGETGVSGVDFFGSVGWTISDSWDTDASYQSPDIKGLVNAALNAGWNAGNSMLLRVSSTSGNRTFWAHEKYDQLRSAQLIISYVDDGTQGANTVREEMISAVNSLDARGYTPVQDTFYEAYQYYIGGDVVWGKFRGGHEANGEEMNYSNASSGPFTYARTSVEGAIKSDTWGGRELPYGCPGPDSSDGDCNDSNGYGKPKGEYLKGNPEYQSPIENYCQAESHIIMLTDGIANNPHSESFIKAIPGIGNCQSTGEDADDSDSQACVLELAELMHDEDMSLLEGKQTIITHTIGFNFSSDWLKDIAADGGGEYKEASDTAELITEIESILEYVLETNSSFVAPVAAINQFNRLTNLNDVYFAVFRPDSVPSWPGNLKKYRLGEVNGERNVLLGVDDNVSVVSDTTGFFKADSRSIWSAEADGANVDEGGAGAQIGLWSSRKVYTYLGDSSVLSADGNALDVANTALTATDLSVSDDNRDEQILWIRGKDVDDEDGDSVETENRYIMGDPLHSKPVAITYSSPDADDPSEDVSIFMGTNAGGIHGIDADNGSEHFMFMPKELLPSQVARRANSSGRNHIYGMDGSITAWTNDAGSDGITVGGDDFVRLYSGMRRGGRSLYALDVTSRENPRYMWHIDNSDSGFEELGQTWSRPIKGRVKLDGEDNPRDVLFFGGGYDPDKDSYFVNLPDSEGRAIFIVDAETGALIWSGGPSANFTKEFADMDYSIPATLAVADMDNDGIDDIIIVGDTGGQVWRFDIALNKTPAELVTGGVILDVAESGDVDQSSNRMFYHSPDVALVERDGSRNLAISIGTGKRPSPLGTAQNDRMYMLFQGAVFGPPAAYVKLTESDLYDTTENLIVEGDTDARNAATTALDVAAGWYFDLPGDGEKVLSTPLTFRDTVTFTTYMPSNAATSCSPKVGTSFVYQVNVLDATPVNDWDDIEGFSKEDRAYELKTPSIIDEPVIICTGAGCDLFTGAEKPPIDTLSSGSIIKTFWKQDQ